MSDGQGPQRLVSEAINMFLGGWPAPDRGFIIVMPSRHAGPTGFARVYSGYDEPPSWPDGARRVAGAQVEQPERWHVFATYQEAYETAQWAVPRWGPGTVEDARIVEVERRPPIRILSDRPVSVLDALAGVVDDA